MNDHEMTVQMLNVLLSKEVLSERWQKAVEDAIQILQGERIVRCKDCIHADISASGLIKCQGRFRTAEWYCADGKKLEQK